MTGSPVGPDIVVPGSARSGTTTLASVLSAHPSIDGGAVKERDYFSRHVEKGPDWYDSTYERRSDDLVRLDASPSYTFPQFPEALERLARQAPDALVLYCVRDPVQRAVSQYHLYRHYLGIDPEPDFGAALRDGSFYCDVSDYDHWLGRLAEVYPSDRILVVPFPVITGAPAEVTRAVVQHLGLPDVSPSAEGGGGTYRNDVRAFRSESARRMAAAVRGSSWWPRISRTLGRDRIRRLRTLVTKETALPSFEDELASCSADQRRTLDELRARVGAVVADRLELQDAREGLAWAAQWRSHTSG